MTVGMPPGRGCSRLRLNQESLKDSEHRRALMGLSMLQFRVEGGGDRDVEVRSGFTRSGSVMTVRARSQ